MTKFTDEEGADVSSRTLIWTYDPGGPFGRPMQTARLNAGWLVATELGGIAYVPFTRRASADEDGSSSGPIGQLNPDRASLHEKVGTEKELGVRDDDKTELLRDPYIIALLNQSRVWTCFAISFNNTDWHATPLVGNTCPNACTEQGILQCFQQGKYKPIATHNCGVQLRVWLKFRNAQGQVGTLTDPYEFFADCNAAGKVLVFCD